MRRPPPLSRSSKENVHRPASLSREDGSKSDLIASKTMAASRPSLVEDVAASRPSLLKDIRFDLGIKLETPWRVKDDSLRPVPIFYPPLNPRCTAIVTDSSPSTVAFRISECLKKRSISVEYDEEMITASCVTIDRVHFGINLYRGNRRSKTSDSNPDLAHAVIVEVVRVRGSSISFHSHNRSILNAAMGNSSGEDTRNKICTGPCEFPRLVSTDGEPPSKRRARSTIDSLPLSLERALSLLNKDRIDVQKSGMESLVNLTDVWSSGVELAVQSSMAVMGAPITTREDSELEGNRSKEIHQFILRLLKDRILPGDDKSDATEKMDVKEPKRGSFSGLQNSVNRSYVDDAYHGGVMRSMGLRVFTNALTVLSKHRPDLLSSLISSSKTLTSREFVQSLSEDLVGGTRLPAVVIGTRLASAHEAALATRCIKILAASSPNVQRLVANPKAEEHPTLDILVKNYESVRHDVLEEESQLAYSELSRDIRTF